LSERPRILITQKVPAPAYPRLAEVGEVDANMEDERIWSSAELLERAPGHDYLYCLVTDTIDAPLLEKCAASHPPLKLVANMATGFNNIDIATATRLGIAVTNTPGVLAETTADLAFGLLLASARRIPEAERYLRAGKFSGWGPFLFCGAEVHHATLGLIGVGRIGKQMTKRASGFDMHILYYNRTRLSPDEEATYNLNYTPLPDLLAQSDFVSIHVPYTPATHHLLGAHEFAQMKSSAILINTARGPIVDEQALVTALQAGAISGAGLDVFEREPAVEAALLDMEQVVLLPHIGSASLHTRTLMATMASDNIVAHSQGQRPPNILNPETLA
jgi:glyoxylate reductase